MSEKKLNIYDSGFSLRANLKEKEKDFQAYWKKIDLFGKIQNKSTKKIYFLSGPPYANGNIHIGHALNKILKDLLIRFNAFQGIFVEYKPGWDTHGLPIATQVAQTNLTKDFVQKPIFREKCLEYALTQVEQQKKQFARLGLLINFENTYITSDHLYIFQQLNLLADIVDQKKITRLLKPVFWSWSSQTALAETEIIYKDKSTDSLFFLFPILDCPKNPKLKESFLLAWTTSIWTIPENQFLVIDKNQDYVQLEWNKKKIIVSLFAYKKHSLLQKLKLLQQFSGNELLKIRYKHCYLNFESVIFHSPHVKEDRGTGIVHCAPAFGEEDFVLAQKNNFSFDVAIDKRGFFNSGAKDKNLINFFYTKAENWILQQIQNSGNFFALKKVIHNYPYDWRTKKPVFYRATAQWYLIDLPKSSKIIRSWYPEWGKERINKNLNSRQEWCISRQRLWGAPIPAFETENNQIILNSELIRCVAQKILKAKTDQIWWTEDLKSLLTPQLISKYKIKKRIFETMDVWFDSGNAALFNYFGQKEDIDYIWEGNDQFRGWFSSLSILSNWQQENKIKKALVHGFVNDENGKKMSKSENNIVDPISICEKFGSDVLRLWVVNSDFYNDVNFGQKILSQNIQNYLKTRNTIRFLINNIVDFQFKKDAQKKVNIFGQLILFEFSKMFALYTDYFANQKFHLAWKSFFAFLNLWLSNFYFDYAKKIIYTSEKDSLQRRQIQTVFHYLSHFLSVMLAPILPHTCEEAYKFLKFESSDFQSESVHLSQWPNLHKISSLIDLYPAKKVKLQNYKNFLLLLKSTFSKVIEKESQAGYFKRSEEITIEIMINKKDFGFIELDLQFLTTFLKVHSIKNISLVTNSDFKIEIFNIQKAKGKMCLRCYKLFQNETNKYCFSCQSLVE